MQKLGASVNDPRLAPMLQQLGALMRQHVASAGLNGRLAVLHHRCATARTRAKTGRHRVCFPHCRRTFRSPCASTSARRAHRPSTCSRRRPRCPSPMPASGCSISTWRTKRSSRCRPMSPGRARSMAVATAPRCAGSCPIFCAPRSTSTTIRRSRWSRRRSTKASPTRAIRPIRRSRMCLKRHVETKGASSALRDVLSGLRNRMVHSAADRSSEGRKLLAHRRCDARAREPSAGQRAAVRSRSPTRGARPQPPSSPRCPPTSAAR